MRYAVLTILAVLIGATDPRVTQSNIGTTICQPGYSRTVRPPVSWSGRVKRQMLHGLPARSYELDHVIPIEVGGAPMDPRNLQIQPWPAARAKDKLEGQVHRAVCAGRMTLEQGQAVFR